MVGRPAIGLLGTLGVIILVGAEQTSANSAAARCTAAKARAAAQVVRRVAGCHAANMLAGGVSGPACFVKAVTKLEGLLARADRAGTCGGNHAYLQELSQSHCIVVPQVFDRCNAAKIRAAGGLAGGKLRCLAHNAGLVDAACFAVEEADFARAFARAEALGPCPGDPDYFASPVDSCIGQFVVALSCGNDRIDPGEQCDGQMFCTDRECRITSEIACCQFGTPPNAICADTFPEMCFAGGFQTAPGFCSGDPVPSICDACKIGGCVDPPIAPTSVCCESSGSCEATSVVTTAALQNELLECVRAGGQPALGSCGATGSCVGS